MKKGRTLLRVLRAEQDVTQEKLARKAGISAARYWQIENGYRHPATTDEQKAVAAALNVKASDIAWPEFEKAAKAS